MHYPQRKTLQSASVVCYITDIRLSRMTPGANVVCYITDDSWRKCRLLDHGYNAVRNDSWAGSHVVPKILHWLVTEEVEKGQILWVHTYHTTSCRRRGRRVRSSVEIGSEMWICIRYTQTNKEKGAKNHFIFIYKTTGDHVASTNPGKAKCLDSNSTEIILQWAMKSCFK